MTNQEAINLIKPLMTASIDTSGAFEKRPIVFAFEKAIEALEKQIPQKPVKLDTVTESRKNFGCCRCNSFVGSQENRFVFGREKHYCWFCGQAIDWSDYNDKR